MEQRKNSAAAIIIAFLGLIVAVIACIAGWLALPQIQRLFDQPPITPRATEVPATEPLNDPPNPTEPPTTELPTNAPPPAPDPDTEPGTILEEGKAWRQGGLELRLVAKEFFPDANLAIVYFTLTNVGDSQRIIEFSQDNFSAVDNLNHRIDTGGISWNFDPYLQHTCKSDTMILEPNDREGIKLSCDRGNWEGVALAVDIADSAITEIIITVSGISSINDARWRIPINH